MRCTKDTTMVQYTIQFLHLFLLFFCIINVHTYNMVVVMVVLKSNKKNLYQPKMELYNEVEINDNMCLAHLMMTISLLFLELYCCFMYEFIFNFIAYSVFKFKVKISSYIIEAKLKI